MVTVRMIRTGPVRGAMIERGALVSDLTRTEANALVNIRKAEIVDDDAPVAGAPERKSDGNRKRK